jgi:hypothetical protein
MAVKIPKGLEAFQLDKQLGYTINDFSPDKDQTAPVGNAASNNNLAAYASVLGATDPNDVVSNYMRINDEQSLLGQSQTQTNLLNKVSADTQAQYTPSLLSTMANPGISDEDKQRAASNFYDQNSKLYTPANVLTTRSLSSPTANSNPEEDSVRLNIGNFSQRMNDEKQQQQQVLNEALAKNEPTTKSSVVAFIDSLIPLASSLSQAKIAAGMDPDNATKAFITSFFSGVGNSRQKLVDMINNQPNPAARQDALQRLADVINNHTGILSSDPNYNENRYELQKTLNGEYTSEDKLDENVGSLIDIVGLAAGPAAKGIEAIQGATKAKTAAEAFNAFKADYEANTKGFKPDSFTDPANPIGNGPSGSGGPSKGATFDATGPETVVDSPAAVKSNVNRDSVRSGVQPASVGQNIKDANVDIGRQLYDAVDQDTSGGKVAEAIYGTNRPDALANGILPEVGHADQSVSAKIADIDGASQLRDIRAQIPQDLLDFANHDGLTQYTQSEIAKTRAWKVNDFESSIAMNERPEMFQIQPGTKNLSDTSTGFTIRGVYGPANNGYSNPKDALQLADYALRSTGIPVDDVHLLKRVGGKYVPTTLEAEAGQFDPGFTPVDSDSGIKAAYNDGRYAETTVAGGKIRLVGVVHGDSGARSVVAFNENGKQVGSVLYGQSTDRIDNPNVRVDPSEQGKGIANAMYDYAEKHGATFPSPEVQQNLRSTSGQGFREARSLRTTKNVFPDGDYLIGIDHNYKVNAADYKAAGASENLDVKNNFLDRGALTDGRQGSAANTLLDIGSMLHPTIYKGALVAADKSKYIEKQLLNMFSEFATPFSKLPRERKNLLLGEIYKANEQSKAFDFVSLKAAGATNQEIDIMNAFKKSQDTLYYFRNQAFGKYLNRMGYEEYVHTGAQTNMVARAVKKGSLGIKPSGFDVYDAMQDKNVRMSSADIDRLYSTGGTLAELRNPFTDTAGNVVRHVSAGNSMAGGYLKSITPSTQVLAYRPGYFGVEYNQPHIIMEKEVDKSGKVFNEHAVATAPDMKAAKLHVNRMNATSNGNIYYHRKNTANKTNRDIADDYDVSVANGESAFRRRGQRLVDTNSSKTNLSKLNIKNPAEVFVSSARRLSNKLAYGDTLAAMDTRAANQYGHLLPKNQFGQTMIPGDKRLVRYRGIGNENGSEIADARTTIQYNNYLRTTGYINLMDDGIKAGLRSFADLLGSKDLGMAERLFSGLSDVSITRAGKTAAYTAFLALSPLRQFIVQSAQISMLTAINPSWMVTKFVPQMLYISMRQMGMDANSPVANILAKGFGFNASTKDADVVWKQFLRSGVSSAIDSSNMISGVLSDLASRMVNQTSRHVTAPIRAVKSVMHGARLVGFDAGEWINSASSWMAHRDMALKSGANVDDPRVLDNISATARNYTGSMNHAGDMPTNQNMLSIIAQFTQQTQKMLGNMTTNRIVPLGTKIKMAFVLMGLFGLPTKLIWSKYMDDVLPDNPQDPSNQLAKKALDEGIEGWTLNHILTKTTGQKVDMDWGGSLSPLNIYGTADLIHNLLTSDAGTIVAKTPAGSLFFGQNPRILNFAKSVAKYTNLMDDYKDPTTFKEVASKFMQISSGYSSYLKAQYAMEYGKKVSSLGRTTDSDVTPVEALLAGAGINTEDEKRQYDVTSQLTATKQQKQADFTQYYNDLKTHLNYNYPNPDALDFTANALSEFNRVYGTDPTYRQFMDTKLKQDVKDGDASIYTNLMRNSGLYGLKDINALIDEYPFKSEQTRQDMKAQINFFDKSDPTEK